MVSKKRIVELFFIIDLPRDIVTIKYNLLNLPDLVQFANGNQIRNTYAADGRKLATEYLTAKVPMIIPLGNTTNLAASNRRQNGTVYSGNKEYKFGDYITGNELYRIHNAEGYVDFESDKGDGTYYFDDRYNYYRRDHLGNIREVWRESYMVHYRTGPVSWDYDDMPGGTVQYTQYYPSGLPWAEGINAGEQPYKYNGKEFIEMHGYDTYDYGARGMYPAIMRFNTMDPLAEKYYSITPYAYCANNPIRYIDPDGREPREGNKVLKVNFNNSFVTQINDTKVKFTPTDKHLYGVASDVMAHNVPIGGGLYDYGLDIIDFLGYVSTASDLKSLLSESNNYSNRTNQAYTWMIAAQSADGYQYAEFSDGGNNQAVLRRVENMNEALGMKGYENLVMEKQTYNGNQMKTSEHWAYRVIDVNGKKTVQAQHITIDFTKGNQNITRSDWQTVTPSLYTPNE